MERFWEDKSFVEENYKINSMGIYEEDLEDINNYIDYLKSVAYKYSSLDTEYDWSSFDKLDYLRMKRLEKSNLPIEYENVVELMEKAKDSCFIKCRVGNYNDDNIFISLDEELFTFNKYSTEIYIVMDHPEVKESYYGLLDNNSEIIIVIYLPSISKHIVIKTSGRIDHISMGDKLLNKIFFTMDYTSSRDLVVMNKRIKDLTSIYEIIKD